ncbi:hypothetical protein PRIPAC_75961, partial [Pristionchus pacificus]|uniref:Uncharacterized protein n=1 Tax=Pristionchus pacificus TaxID=54126 RepID=A0A2A6CT23_PRIPA
SGARAKPYLLSVGEGVARDGDEGVLLGVEHSGGGVHSQSLHKQPHVDYVDSRTNYNLNLFLSMFSLDILSGISCFESGRVTETLEIKLPCWVEVSHSETLYILNEEVDEI